MAKTEIIDVRLRAELNGKVRDQFLEIKKAKGLTNNTDVVRLIISEYHRVLKERGLL